MFEDQFWYDSAELVSQVLCMESEFVWEHQLERIWKLAHPAEDIATWVPQNVALLCRTPDSTNCGLHVHIGYGYEDMPWKTVQFIYILWGIYEEEIEALHPLVRRSEYNEYAMSLRSNCTNFTFKGYAQGIMGANNPHELLNLLTPKGKETRDLKIGISARRGRPGEFNFKDTTLEFREAAGTVNNIPIAWWVKFIEAVVRLAQSLVNIDFDLVGDLYAVENMRGSPGRPGLMLEKSIFDHIAITSGIPQEGLDYFEERKRTLEDSELPEYYDPDDEMS